eukprot:CAMPEP_0170503466 /NCGR_PEP_ID=MMETSP0208-20121228/44872_1 /TAXON_ID=197538 /ORGANISM="Strombidium inclinatum, Strain S3" /LENGTH=30 /DNA_ID= /DNA_START= /DNA_END= /DNA_ORIENTATION=
MTIAPELVYHSEIVTVSISKQKTPTSSSDE